MKNFKEFKPLMKLISKKEKKKFILSSILMFLSGISSIFTGLLNGLAVEAITKGELKKALVFLLIYFFIEINFDGFINKKTGF